jgi:hypothetical protein
MTELEIALQAHDWSLDGWRTRPQVDQLMKSHPDPAEAQALWQQYCPWSNSNGGYVVWSKKFIQDNATMIWSYQ